MHLRRDVQSVDKPMEKEMLELAIFHVAKYWQIGLLMSSKSSGSLTILLSDVDLLKISPKR